jgi:putative SOS response-associated peptidase YedK
MCGRFRLGKGREALKEYFGAEVDIEWSPRYNIAPTQPIPAVRQNASWPARVLSLTRWGLIPYWAKDPSIGYKLINARSETAASKPAFGDALKSRRCLIPADGFYEWKKLPKAKQPFCFVLQDESIFAFAGLWDRWKDPDGNLIESCSILTTSPNELLAGVHDRMPVILPPDDYDLWLDPGFKDMQEVSALLKPYRAGLMRGYPVRTRVNVVDNDDPLCAEPFDPHSSQASLLDITPPR